MFDINITLGIQLINFIVTIVVLNYLLIQPIRGVVKKRRDLASGMLRDADTFTAQANGKLENYENILAKAREEAAAMRDTKKNEGTSREAELLGATHRDAQEYLQSSREETRKAVADAMTALEKRIPEFSKMVTARLLGKMKRSPAA